MIRRSIRPLTARRAPPALARTWRRRSPSSSLPLPNGKLPAQRWTTTSRRSLEPPSVGVGLELADESDLGLEILIELLANRRLGDVDQFTNVGCGRMSEIDDDI